MRRADSTSAEAAVRLHSGIAAALGLRPRVRFTAADELSCYYDGPATPANIHVELRIPSALDEAALRLAVGAALAAHPRAMVRRSRAGWWRHRHKWEQPPCPDIDPVIATTWVDEDQLGRARERFLKLSPPLDCSPPLRILLAAGPAEDRLILNAHHAAFDGISCVELLRSVSRHYQAAISVGTEPTPARPAQEPSTAANTKAGARTPVSSAELTAPSHVARLGLPRPAARIAADGDGDSEGDSSSYGFRLLTLPVPVFPRTGPGPHTTVNDLVIAALVTAIGRWNADHGQPGGQIRITMPLNARTPGADRLAGNLSRLAAVAASPPGRDLRQLLADVTAQTRWAKEHAGPQVDPLSRALAAAWCPSGLKRLALRLALRTAGPLLCDTCMATNLGIVADAPEFGRAPGTGIWVTGPAQMPRGLSVAVITLGGQLHLGLRYSRALFSDRAAADFTAGYFAALTEVTRAAARADGDVPVGPGLGTGAAR
jgi:NRPS condensation-like uncharacterized protein